MQFCSIVYASATENEYLPAMQCALLCRVQCSALSALHGMTKHQQLGTRLIRLACPLFAFRLTSIPASPWMPIVASGLPLTEPWRRWWKPWGESALMTQWGASRPGMDGVYHHHEKCQ